MYFNDSNIYRIQIKIRETCFATDSSSFNVIFVVLQSKKLGLKIWRWFMGIWQTSYENERNTKGKQPIILF